MKRPLLLLIYLCLNLFVSCASTDAQDDTVSDIYFFRDKMRTFIENISTYAKEIDTSFLIVPQNGIELITKGENTNDSIALSYLNAIDAHGQEDLFYGYDGDDKPTPEQTVLYLREFLDISKNYGKAILVTDYVSTPANITESYNNNQQAGYTSFAADQRELNSIPDYPAPIYSENATNIKDIDQVRNFLYLLNADAFDTKKKFLDAIAATNYDLIILDLFFNTNVSFTKKEIKQLKRKKNGGSRLVIAYMSIGEAEDYRYYWKETWSNNPPAWLNAENPNWKGNYKVRYWDLNWQKLIYGSMDSYLDKIIDADFDGVYLDIVDAFEYYE